MGRAPPDPALSGWRALGAWAGILGEILAFCALWSLLLRALVGIEGATRSLLRPQAPAYPFETPAWLLAFALAFGVLFPLLRRALGGWRAADFGLRAEDAAEARRVAVLLPLVSL